MRTLRLVLEPISMDDLGALQRMLTQRGVRRFLFDNRILSAGEVEAMLRTSRDLFVSDGIGLWALRMYGVPGEMLGFAGLWPFHEPAVNELSFALDTRYWKRGFATEACEAMLRYARKRLGWKQIQASIDPGNIRSAGVLMRLGFVECGQLPGNGGTPLSVFRRPL